MTLGDPRSLKNWSMEIGAATYKPFQASAALDFNTYIDFLQKA